MNQLLTTNNHEETGVHQLFEVVAEKYPELIALVFDSKSITYDELNSRANNLRNMILYESYEEEVIGISTSRSLEMVISILAILKAGKTYLPLDPDYPKNRLQQIKEDSGVKTCVCLNRDIALFKNMGFHIIASDEEYSIPATSSYTQYDNGCILYTSGSTGKPKGVCLGHIGLINFINWQRENSICGPGVHSLQFCHLSFDASFMEIFMALTQGGTLHLITTDDRLDGGRLLNFIERHHINKVFLPYVTLQYLADSAVKEQKFPASLNEVTTGGELLKITPTIRQFFNSLPNSLLVNIYGPTEATVCVTTQVLEGNAANWPDIPTIGSPMAGAHIFFLDENLKIVENDEIGELCISGLCLANGYFNQPEMTNEKFLNWQHPEAGPVRIYKTGDLGRFLDNGEIDFRGRKDGQVKIRGNRVELGEIEIAIINEGQASQSVVILREDYPERKTLVAYLVCEQQTFNAQELRRYISRTLPDYMVPASFVCLNELPKTTSGKVDKKALPKPDIKRPALNVLYRKPGSETEKDIAKVLLETLLYDKIGIDDNFFELGGNSILAQKTVSELRYQFNYQLPITKLYQFPTIAGIARYLDKQKRDPRNKPSLPLRSRLASDIAVVGMAGRFPGADSIDGLWDILINGKETTTFFSLEEIDKFVPDHLKQDPSYVKARGIVDKADQFDPLFFGINQKLAELMDPQQRIFLEISHEVLEKTGCLPSIPGFKIGVFAGSGSNTYYENNVLPNKDLVEKQGKLQVLTVNEKDYIATRTAYHINLNGPAVSVNSACSTSLLAVVEAVNSLRSGQCDAALAGGSSVTVPIHSGHLYQEGSMLSADGHCRPFDDEATGTVFSDGAGVVLLKRLQDAEENGDFIYGVIRGVGVNNDGSLKGSFTAPSADSQADAISMAISDAHVNPADISYVEAHGTGTPLGDPIEFEGLITAFGPQQINQFCALGSVKSNFGHLTQAAGVTGLIKACLALHHKKIPASLGYITPNRNINFKNSPFYVNHELTDWVVKDKRIAGVSSFGVGGTNVHVILEEYENKELKTSAGRPFELITWSANTETSREKYGKALAEYGNVATTNLADVAYTLQKFRNAHKYRSFIVADNVENLKKNLEKVQSKSAVNHLEEAPGEIVFSFPGQGAQYLNMGKTLYNGEIVYKEAVDLCASILTEYIKIDIREILFPEAETQEAEDRLKDTKYTQPALFVTEYALARLWMHWGIIPTLFCGHSIGEYVAAHLSGIFSLADALKLIARRGLMVSQLPSGGMLSVRHPHQKISELLNGNLSIAAINSPGLCVVAGPMSELTMLSKQLDVLEIANKALFTSHAFHSSMMDPIVDDFKIAVAETTLSVPAIPIISTVTGELLTAEQAIDPAYWAMHLRETVRFSDAISTILTYDTPLFLEVGPGAVTATLIKQIAGSAVRVIHSLLHTADDYQSILTALGYLWNNGLQPHWDNYYSGQHRNTLMLPSYQFDRRKFWVSPKEPETQQHTLFADQSTEITKQRANHTHTMRTTKLTLRIKQLLEDASGVDMQNVEPNRNFLEIGLDSLLLTQVAISLKKEFNLPITFRKLNEEYPSVEALVNYIDQNIAPDPIVETPAAVQANPYTEVMSNHLPYQQPMQQPVNHTALSLIAQQLEILSKQVFMMQGYTSAPVGLNHNGPATASFVPPVAEKNANSDKADLSAQEKIEIHKPFGATPKIDRQSTALNDKQSLFLKELTSRYNNKTAKSKQYAAESRDYMADPRVVSGFKPATKELVYPIVINKSSGSKMWDIDGNEYIDVLNGFGSNMLGYQPAFIKKAMHDQIDKGYEVGPQHELAADVSKLVCEFTGFDRSALCSTGSEAVLGCIRIARTVTGRSLIVAFTGSYHGIIDEVLVRGTKKLKSFPAAAGIMADAVKNILVLDYGTDEALAIIKERAGEIAAVIAEPIQSRRPEFVPIEFLKKVREITSANGAALIFDEVITGFRMHPGGAQALFDIRADLAAYGKVVGAGIPIGVIAGKKEFMDALDGGSWKYGDQSYPEVGVTYFAGTFVRHPLALASAKASLEYMKEKGSDLQKSLNDKGAYITNTLNEEIEKRQLPFFVANYGSLWKIKFHEEIPYSELMFILLREKGIHIIDGFPCFITEATSDADIDQIIKCFTESMDEMISAGFYNAISNSIAYESVSDNSEPPIKGAKLGKDIDGNPAWFIEDKQNPGKYLQIQL